MAVIPLQLAQRSLDTGGTVQYGQGGETGRAIQGAGDELSSVADAFQRRQDEFDKFKRIAVENEFDQATANQSEELARNAPADGSGIHDGIVGQVDQTTGQVVKPGLFDTLAQQFRDRVPASQQGYFDASLGAKRLHLSGAAAATQYGQEQKYATLETAKIQDGLLNSILQTDPADTKSFDAYKEKGKEAIQSSPLSPLAKQATLDAWESNSAKALGQAIIERDPGKLRAMLGMAAPADVQTNAASVLRKFEGFRDKPYWDVNANRLGYGSDTITRADGSYRKVQPGDQVTREDAERDLARRAADFETEAVNDVGQAAWDRMPPNARAALVSTAYNYGSLPRSVAAAVRGGDVNQVASAVEALGGQNGGINRQRRKDEAAIIRGGSIPDSGKTDQRFALLSPEDRLALANQDDVAFRQKQTADNAQAKVEYSAYKDHIELGIRTGDIKDPALILTSKLNEGDQATLLGALQTQNKENAGVDELLGAIKGGDKVTINPFDETQTKLGDKAYDQFLSGVPAEQQAQAAGAYVQSTGYIPKKVQATLQMGATSTDPGQFAAAMSTADALQSRAPTAFNNFPGGKDVRDRLTMFQSMVNDRGMSADEASRKIIAMADPAKLASQAVLKPQAEKFLKNLTVGDVTNSFDPGYLSSEPGAGLLPTQQNALLAEYKSLAEDRFYETGDAGTAKALALADIKRTWGPSSVSGSAQLMRMPPEQHYPQAGGGFDYLRDDALASAKDFVSKTFPGRVVDNITIVAGAGRDNSWSTRGDIEAGRPPRYQLWYTYKQDGQQMSDVVLDAPWGLSKADVDTAVAKGQDSLGKRAVAASDASNAANDAIKSQDAAADQAMKDTVGPAWMKARAAEAARERARMDEGTRRMQAPKAEPGANIPIDIPGQDQFDAMGNATGMSAP